MGDDRQRLEARLARLGSERLAEELVDLAAADPDVERRVKLLAREGDPGQLGAELRRRIAGLKRASRFVHYGESLGLAGELRELVEAIEDSYDSPGFGASVRLGLVAETLRDAALYERSMTLRGGALNERQVLR